MSDQNIAAVRRLTQEGFVGGKADVVDEIVAEDCIDHDPMPGQGQGREGQRHTCQMVIDGLSDRSTLRTVHTAEGFVTEHEEHQRVNGRDLTARRLWLCQVRVGAIVEAVGYCSGEWDEELRARHAAEAPMIRP
jgi:hypothetical protein